MKISLPFIFGCLSLIATLPAHPMDNAQTSLFCTLDAPVLEKIASSITRQPYAIGKIVKPSLELTDICAVQQTCKYLHDNFHSSDKNMIIDFECKRTSEGLEEFLNRVIKRLILIKNYPHSNKIVLNLSSNNLYIPSGPFTSKGYLRKFFNDIKQIGLADRIVELDLSQNNLPFVPDSLLQLTNLERLDLSSNALTINETAKIYSLRSLKQLSLRFNFITAAFSPAIADTKLESLDLAYNPLEFPHEHVELGCLKTSLKSLYLSQTGIHPLPDILFDFENLTTLDLSGNPVLNYNDELNKLKRLQKLEVLRLGGNIHYHCTLNVACLPPHLTDLDVSRNQIGSAEVSKLCTIATLERLVLDGTGLHTIPAKIARLNKLKILSIADNFSLHLDAVKNICLIPNLEDLCINNNGLTRLPAQLGYLCKLKYLEATGNDFKKEEVQAILKLLPPGCKVYPLATR